MRDLETILAQEIHLGYLVKVILSCTTDMKHGSTAVDATTLVSCTTRWSLYLPLALCGDHLGIISVSYQPRDLVSGVFQVKGTDLWGVGFKSGFFGPKVVSWTEWEALVPILALLRPFRGVFGSWVDFGALWGSNFWNNQMDPLFLILLLILHLNSWKRYTFDISGPKWAQNSQNRLKMAKIRYSHMAIFWKNITSDLSQNGPKYKSRTILHFDIGLG